MNREVRSVLVVTDLTPHSDAAVSWALALVHAYGAELHLVHALSLVPERWKGAPVLLRLDRHIREADAAARMQVLRLGGRIAPIPVISLDSVAAMLRMRCAQLRPDVVVLPPGLEWDEQNGRDDLLNLRTLRALDTPVLIAGAPPAVVNELVLVTHSAFISSLMEHAVDWWAQLRSVLQGTDTQPDVTDLAVWLLDEHGELDTTDLGMAEFVVVPLPRAVYASRAMNRTVGTLLARKGSPILLLPEGDVALTPPAEDALLAVPS